MALGLLESALGRRLHTFHLSTAEFGGCGTGRAPCALWEAATGRVWVGAGVARSWAQGHGVAQLVAAVGARLAGLVEGVAKEVRG